MLVVLLGHNTVVSTIGPLDNKNYFNKIKNERTVKT